ncbi:hypothetical protein [Singulisphaera acidiphila]|uniref:Alginate lyase n=1 Tax=Singulisphaera acidiphila (strain ATCC BAA-1392 / DSM 18658 / VKM B-2454 / MOB10) TaxID=886293 RepID=L0DBM6_SINAD|nr:hypothetical protein [Singulisphaera acidiphila]AGA26779.1 hypothetical protein Sinac_2470 [Singulisphaera acidiphila DSM 18658]
MFDAPMNRRAFLGGALALAGAPALPHTPRPSADVPPIPQLARWWAQMIKFGKTHAASLKETNGPLDPLLGATYYDAQRVLLQIADFSADRSWLVAADHAMAIYRDRYVLANDGKVPGYWIFPHGLAMHYQRTKDPKSREALVALSQNAAFASDSAPAAWSQNVAMSREVAYNIHNLMKAEEVGEPHRPRLRLLVDQALGHIDQWFISRTAPFHQPFMFGLTAEALIAYHAKTGDARIPEAIRVGADWLWKNTWIAKSRAFRYVDHEAKGVGGPEPAPDLNLLIAPAFAWLYRRTGNAIYRDRGDAIFAGGVDQAWLIGGKQFNQNYRWSFDYVTWRTEGDRSVDPNRHRGNGKG